VAKSWVSPRIADCTSSHEFTLGALPDEDRYILLPPGDQQTAQIISRLRRPVKLILSQSDVEKSLHVGAR
jgi:hypothetical protein